MTREHRTLILFSKRWGMGRQDDTDNHDEVRVVFTSHVAPSNSPKFMHFNDVLYYMFLCKQSLSTVVVSLSATTDMRWSGVC